MQEKTPFTSWFNISDKTHLEALSHLRSVGHWPKHFLPADVEFCSPSDLDTIYQKIVSCYLTENTKPVYRNFVGIPPSCPDFPA
jgi:hypothetical protein